MKYLYLIIFAILIFHTKAQNFNTIHWGNSNPLGGAPCMVVENDTLFAFSFMQNDGRTINYRSFNRQGGVLDSTSLLWDTTVYGVALRTNGLAVLNNKQLIAIHDIFYQNGTSVTKLFKFNKQLDTLQTKQFAPFPSSVFNSFDVLVEDTAITILGHYALPNKKLNLYLARYDTALNLQWHTTIADFRPAISGLYSGYYPYHLSRMGNNYYITGRSLIPNQFVEGFLVKTDLQGNKVWDKRYQFQGFNTVTFSILPLGSDSLFEASLYRSSTINSIGYNKAILRIRDANGQAIDSVQYPEEETQYEFTNTALSTDNNILLTGFYYTGGTKGLIWKLDKNLNTIWRRVYYYGQWEDESWLYNIDQWSDGGLIAVGSYFDRYQNPNYEAQFLWLLSTDSTGCLGPGNCGSGISVVEWALPGQGIKLYPNPATDFINIELSLPNLQNTTATVRLFNLAGQEVLRQQVQFEGGKSQLSLSEFNVSFGQYVLELKTETHLFMEKIIVAF
jgi:hypothetical protein